MSLTKLAASTAHLLAAVMFVHLQWGEPFDETLWLIYLGFAVGHATVDKSSAMVKNFKDRKLDAESPTPSTETTIVQTTKE